MDENKVQDPIQVDFMSEAIAAAQRAAKAQEGMLMDQLEFRKTHQPISLRDKFAIAALAAIISRGDLDTDMNVMPYCEDAYTIADAMLEAREAE